MDIATNTQAGCVADIGHQGPAGGPFTLCPIASYAGAYLNVHISCPYIRCEFPSFSTNSGNLEAGFVIHTWGCNARVSFKIKSVGYTGIIGLQTCQTAQESYWPTPNC